MTDLFEMKRETLNCSYPEDVWDLKAFCEQTFHMQMGAGRTFQSAIHLMLCKIQLLIDSPDEEFESLFEKASKK